MRFAPGFRFLPFFAALILASLYACLTSPSGPPAHVGMTGRFTAVA